MHLSRVEHYIELQYTHSPPLYSFQRDEDFKLSQAHFWSWHSKGEAKGTLEIMWSEEHKLTNLMFGPLKTENLFFGILKDKKWYANIPLFETLNASYETRFPSFQFGFLADQVAKIYPELVYENNTEKETQSIDYIGMIPLLLEVVKAQQKQIEILEKKSR